MTKAVLEFNLAFDSEEYKFAFNGHKYAKVLIDYYRDLCQRIEDTDDYELKLQKNKFMDLIVEHNVELF